MCHLRKAAPLTHFYGVRRLLAEQELVAQMFVQNST